MKHSNYFSLIIVFAIVSAVSFGAGVMVSTSLIDDYSNLHIARRVISLVRRHAPTGIAKAFLGNGSARVSSAMIVRDVESQVPQMTPQVCPDIVSRPTNSLIDYLRAKSMPVAFEYRKEFALQYGIEGYSGTAGQNARLLDTLIQKDASDSGCTEAR